MLAQSASSSIAGASSTETDASGIVALQLRLRLRRGSRARDVACGGLERRTTAHRSLAGRGSAASFDFFKALRFEDEIDVRIRVVGRTAKTFSYQSIVMLGDEIAAIGSTTTICVQNVAGQPTAGDRHPRGDRRRFEVVERFRLRCDVVARLQPRPTGGPRGPPLRLRAVGQTELVDARLVVESSGRGGSFHAGIGALPGG